MRGIALTRARSMGPVATAVQRGGGSVARVFRRAELPLSLLAQPDLLIPLRDQLRVVELAARELDDDALPARLSLEGGVEHLGAFGRHVCSAPLLGSAIARCNDHMSSMLQSATCLRLSREGRTARWTYSVTDGTQIGRQKNEILALGYMLDLLRRYFNVPCAAIHAQMPGACLAGRTSIRDLFGLEIERGEVAALLFAADYLDATHVARRIAPVSGQQVDVPLPKPSDFIANVERMILLGRLECRPSEAWLCRRLAISQRTLQRALAANRTSFRRMLHQILVRQATELLMQTRTPITQIALDLGYTDPAHFTRAFTRWFGEAPQVWRRRMLERADDASA